MRDTKLSVLKVAQLLIIGVALWLSLFLRVSCASNPIVTISGITSTDRAKLDNLIPSINADVKANADIGWDFLTPVSGTQKDTYSIEIDINRYKNYEIDTKKKIMETALSEISNSDLSLTNRNKLYNFIANEDTSTSNLVRQLSSDVNADFGRAYFKYFKPWSGVLGTALGIIALGIFVLLGLVTSIDLAYLTIPIIQEWFNGDSAKAKPKYVSLEAANALKEAESASNGRKRDVVMCYMKSKTKQYVALAICLLYLISGNIYNLIATFIDYFSGVLS